MEGDPFEFLPNKVFQIINIHPIASTVIKTDVNSNKICSHKRLYHI